MAEPLGSWPQVAALSLLALALRGPRLVTRWDEVALAYAAYPEPTVAALADGRLLDAATTWMGLHPPLWPLLHAGMELVAPIPGLFLLASVLASVGAVAAVTRAGGAAAGLVLATGPLQLAYAAEVHNYPLAVGLVGLCLAAARGPWGALAAAAILAGHTHVLAGGIAAGLVLDRALQAPRSEGAKLVAAVGLGLLPVASGAVAKMGEGSTFSQPQVDWAAWGAMVWESTGWAGLLLGVVAAAGLSRWVLAGAAGGGLVLSIALLSGAAAGHQRPYFVVLAPLLAVAVGRAVARHGRGVAVAVVLLSVARAAPAVQDEWDRHRALAADRARPRALDAALAQAGPGDTVWIVAPALQADDDKTATSPVLQRLSPWTLMPIARPVHFEYTDWRYGQPRRWNGLVVHTSTELEPGPLDHVARAALGGGHRVWVVLAEHGPATGLLARVERAVRPYDAEQTVVPVDLGLGDDHLWRLDAVSGSAP